MNRMPDKDVLEVMDYEIENGLDRSVIQGGVNPHDYVVLDSQLMWEHHRRITEDDFRQEA